MAESEYSGEAIFVFPRSKVFGIVKTFFQKGFDRTLRWLFEAMAESEYSGEAFFVFPRSKVFGIVKTFFQKGFDRVVKGSALNTIKIKSKS